MQNCLFASTATMKEGRAHSVNQIHIIITTTTSTIFITVIITSWWMEDLNPFKMGVSRQFSNQNGLPLLATLLFLQEHCQLSRIFFCVFFPLSCFLYWKKEMYIFTNYFHGKHEMHCHHCFMRFNFPTKDRWYFYHSVVNT